MRKTLDILEENFEKRDFTYFFKFGDYELCFEKLLFDNQWAIGLYDKNLDLIIPKIPVKIGKE